jgi:hypothetical protein
MNEREVPPGEMQLTDKPQLNPGPELEEQLAYLHSEPLPRKRRFPHTKDTLPTPPLSAWKVAPLLGALTLAFGHRALRRPPTSSKDKS